MLIVALAAGIIRLFVIARDAYLEHQSPYRIVKFDAAGRSYLVRATWPEWLTITRRPWRPDGRDNLGRSRRQAQFPLRRRCRQMGRVDPRRLVVGLVRRVVEPDPWRDW